MERPHRQVLDQPAYPAHGDLDGQQTKRD